MKNYITFIVFCLISTIIYSQSDSSRFSFGLSFNPHLSNKAHNVSPDYEFYNEVVQYDKFKIGWTTGILAKFMITNNLSLESGLYYSNKGCAGHDPLHSLDSIRDVIIAREGKFPEDLFYKGNHYYIDIPLSIDYAIYRRENSTYYTKIGVITNYYILASGYVKINYDDGSQYINHGKHNYRYLKRNYQLFNLSGLCAVGINYSINKTFAFLIEPNFDITFFPLGDIEIDKLRYYNIGIRCCFLMH